MSFLFLGVGPIFPTVVRYHTFYYFLPKSYDLGVEKFLTIP